MKNEMTYPYTVVERNGRKKGGKGRLEIRSLRSVEKWRMSYPFQSLLFLSILLGSGEEGRTVGKEKKEVEGNFFFLFSRGIRY